MEQSNPNQTLVPFFLSLSQLCGLHKRDMRWRDWLDRRRACIASTIRGALSSSLCPYHTSGRWSWEGDGSIPSPSHTPSLCHRWMVGLLNVCVEVVSHIAVRQELCPTPVSYKAQRISVPPIKIQIVFRSSNFFY
jgi:hypothetical protein